MLIPSLVDSSARSTSNSSPRRSIEPDLVAQGRLRSKRTIVRRVERVLDHEVRHLRFDRCPNRLTHADLPFSSKKTFNAKQWRRRWSLSTPEQARGERPFLSGTSRHTPLKLSRTGVNDGPCSPTTEPHSRAPWEWGRWGSWG
jgi:hypothetical protein